MKGRNLALKLITSFALLALMFSGCVRLFYPDAALHISQSKQICYAIPTSSLVFLAEVEPPFTSFVGSTPLLSLIHSLPFQEKILSLYERQQAETSNQTCPLWLLNRALLV
ncbi:MAG: hypothetical protein K2Z81_14445 [Cyanobacteria bacterium]|nr:hypothetical protein [Cyanobacteriota bacterium]